MITIDNESRQLSRHPANMDNLSIVNTTLDSTVSFSTPDMRAIHDNIFYLLKNSKKIKFEAKYNQKPQYLSIDYYGSNTFAEIIMIINTISNIHKFTGLDYIFLPTEEAIRKVIMKAKKIKNQFDNNQIDWSMPT